MNRILASSFICTSVFLASTDSAFARQAASAPQAAPVAEIDAAAAAIFDESIVALGGQAAIEKINTIYTVVEVQDPNQPVTLNLSWQRAGGRLMKLATAMGEMSAGTDGKTTWRNGPMGLREVTDPKEAQSISQQAALYMNILDPKNATRDTAKSISAAGLKTFDGKECQCLHFVNIDGTQGDMYYDAATKLPVGTESVPDPSQPDFKTTMVMSDWQDAAGVKFFRLITVTNPMQAAPTQVKITTVDINTLDDAHFAPPAAPASQPVMPSIKPITTRPDAPQPGAAPSAPADGEIKLQDLSADQQTQAAQMLDNLRKSGNVDDMKQMVQRVEPMLGLMPADKKPLMQYVIQELKKDIAKAGG